MVDTGSSSLQCQVIVGHYCFTCQCHKGSSDPDAIPLSWALQGDKTPSKTDLQSTTCDSPLANMSSDPSIKERLSEAVDAAKEKMSETAQQVESLGSAMERAGVTGESVGETAQSTSEKAQETSEMVRPNSIAISHVNVDKPLLPASNPWPLWLHV